MRIGSSQAAGRRSGVVLLVVLAMLALFASVALSFVFYADSEAVAARLNAQSLVQDQPNIDPEVLASYFLGQFIYDTDNVYSAMRGWSLARSLYGYNPNALNYVPYNGAGRTSFAPPTVNDPDLNIPMFNMVNYQVFSDPSQPATNATVNFVRNPEYYGKVAFGQNPLPNPATPNGTYRYVGGANPPWTTYDTNSIFLAQSTAKGEVLLRSFFRHWTDPNNIWTDTTAAAKYMTLRPHVTWNPSFSPPDDLGGDVRNFDFGLGTLAPNGTYYNNDSFWMDLGFPILTAPNGQRYKPLFAAKVDDLCNRLHLWAHGNRKGTNGTHVSNLGIGSTEVNPSRLPSFNAAELQALFNLKYGGPSGTSASLPAGSPITFPINRGGPFNALLDFDAVNPATGTSSNPMFLSFTTTSAKASTAGNGKKMEVAQVAGVSTGTSGGFPWSMTAGMQLLITDVPAAPAKSRTETVTVISVNSAANPPTFTANFLHLHPAGVQVSFGSGFPTFPAGWDNLAVNETTNNPLALSMYNPTSPNLGVLPESNMEALLRFGGTNSPALTSEIFRRMPQSFGDMRMRNMVTMSSRTFDRVGSSPYLTLDRTQTKNYLYGNVAANLYPTIVTPPTNPLDYSNASSVTTTNSDYGVDWRSTLSNRLRVNLNRALTDYPAAAASGFITDTATYGKAWSDRTQFASDIYKALVRATGARDPNVVTGMATTGADYQAARWLAQLAVNMVDYIDYDDNSTAWNWNATAAAASSGAIPSEWVFGTELPRLVLSEVYGQNDNDPKDPGIKTPVTKGMPKATYTNLNFWVEVFNPYLASTAAYPTNGGAAQLEINGTPIYQVIVYQTNPSVNAKGTLLGGNTGGGLRDPNNPQINFGNPDPAQFSPLTLSTPTDWGTGIPQVAPGGYFVLGPSQTTFVATTQNPHLKSTYASTSMTVKNANPNVTVNNASFLLQRLAVPTLAPQSNPASLQYNPYITIDYLDNTNTTTNAINANILNVWDNRFYNQNGPVPTPQVPTSFKSFGRMQPYAASATANQIVAQTSQPTTKEPYNTLGLANAPLTTPFDWLVHLDRPLINQLELLHVPGFKPHELTQQFVTPAGTFQHYAPWSDPNSLIYRALELMGTPNHLAGTFPGGRWPGNINLNTLMEPEIFQALCDSQDAQLSPLYRQADITNLFNSLIASRNPVPDARMNTLLTPNVKPNSDGLPFKPFSAASTSGSTVSFSDTLFRVNSAGQSIFKLGAGANPASPVLTFGTAGNHPYLRDALLRKIYNNVTMTSNVFAVSCTIGFFAVTDETVRPARLGAEIGLSENRQIRHRFFAIVDRSGMQLVNPTTPLAIGALVTAGGTSSPPTASAVTLQTPMTGTTSLGVPYGFQPGMQLEIDQGVNAEVVTVLPTPAPTTSSFSAYFNLPHAAGARVICRGNPGPQYNYSPHKDTGVVLHLSVIK